MCIGPRTGAQVELVVLEHRGQHGEAMDIAPEPFTCLSTSGGNAGLASHIQGCQPACPPALGRGAQLLPHVSIA